MNLFSYIINFFQIIVTIFSSFKGPNIYNDNDIEFETIDGVEYMSSRATDLIMEDIQYDTVIDNNPSPTPVEEEPTVRHRTNRRCGYCREVGHNVTECTNNEVLIHNREFVELINNLNTTDSMIREWMANKSEALIKVILCKKRLVRFTSHIERSELQYVIMQHIQNINRGRNALQNIINNVNEIVHEYRGELQLPRFEIADTEVYNKLSITTSEVTNNSDDIICPICFETREQKNICKTNCNHEFCKDCMNKSLRDNIIIKNESRCPLCRSKITNLFLSSN